MPLRSEFAPTGDQPFLNYCADVERWSVRHASDVIGAGLAEIGGVEFPRLVADSLRLFPPAAGADHVESAVAVHVAHP